MTNDSSLFLNEDSCLCRCGLEALQHLKYLESVLHVSKRRGNLNTLDRITHLQQRLARNLQTFISSRFLAKRRSHTHPFHDRRRYADARNLVVQKLRIAI